MLVKDFECRSYDQAVKLLGNRQRRIVCSNTDLVLAYTSEGPHIGLLLHGHEIVWFVPGLPGGHMLLWSRGYRTVTTKDRINRCLPGSRRLYQRNRQWFVLDSRSVDKGIEFTEGMLIEEDTLTVVDSGD